MIVFPRGLPGVSTLAGDLEACGVPFGDERRYRMDFHALRHTFASLPADGDVSDLVRRPRWRAAREPLATDPSSSAWAAGDHAGWIRIDISPSQFRVGPRLRLPPG